MIAPGYRIELGDCRESLRAMAARGERVQMCVTSPPYFGLRDYGHDGQLGLEPTPDAYVSNMVAVFREVRRVLADDGTLWLNIGDSYAGGSKAGEKRPGSGRADGVVDDRAQRNRNGVGSVDGCKPKDLIGIPWLLAFALRSDGWYLRQDIIWHKPNPMPESVRDRCTKAHEYVFLLSKSERYFIDPEGMKEPAVKGAAGSEFHTGKTGQHQLGRASTKPRSKADSFKREGSKREQTIPGQGYGTHRPDRDESAYSLDTRNRRSVWTVATRPYKGAHFATFPPALIEPCILAGSRPGDTVLDPFGGSGTTAGVAMAHGRNAVLCELNQDYADLTPDRVDSILQSYGKAPKPKKLPKPADDMQAGLFGAAA